MLCVAFWLMNDLRMHWSRLFIFGTHAGCSNCNPLYCIRPTVKRSRSPGLIKLTPKCAISDKKMILFSIVCHSQYTSCSSACNE